jgi:hypothetical protein
MPLSSGTHTKDTFLLLCLTYFLVFGFLGFFVAVLLYDPQCAWNESVKITFFCSISLQSQWYLIWLPVRRCILCFDFSFFFIFCIQRFLQWRKPLFHLFWSRQYCIFRRAIHKFPSGIFRCLTCLVLVHWQKCAIRYCPCVTDLLLLGKTANYCSLLMHRPTIAHAPTNYCSCTDRAIIGRLPSNHWSVTEQLLVGYPPTIDHIMGNNTASRNTYYWSYMWSSTGRIIFWV